MHHEAITTIDDKAPVWIVMRGLDGRLQEQIDPGCAAALLPGQSAEEIAGALIAVAGEMEVASNRVW